MSVNNNTLKSDQKYKVFIVEDHELYRQGVISALDNNLFEIVGFAEDVEPAVIKIVQEDPDVILLDVHLPSGSGAEVVQKVNYIYEQRRSNGLINCETPPFLALSVSDSFEDVTAVVKAGAKGYINKTISKNDLNNSLEQAAQGFTVFSPKLAGFILSAFNQQSTAVEEDDKNYESDLNYRLLSKTEKAILRLIAQGNTYKEVAKERGISVRTVETHVSHVLKKLHLNNRNEISFWASQKGLI
ncbi:MAG: response regulator transcription factor [Candidatus Ancillula sp.]|jgi:DNA-binding NarL/FixJ family response regulator|nr:response regulator transcription factor [Candidatus Ancillula sp.]